MNHSYNISESERITGWKHNVHCVIGVRTSQVAAVLLVTGKLAVLVIEKINKKEKIKVNFLLYLNSIFFSFYLVLMLLGYCAVCIVSRCIPIGWLSDRFSDCIWCLSELFFDNKMFLFFIFVLFLFIHFKPSIRGGQYINIIDLFIAIA